MVYTCGTCWKGFPAGWHAREQHCDALGHDSPYFECNECDEYFDNENQKQYHMRNTCYPNEDTVECGVCDRTFPNNEKCADHEIEYHFYCCECERFFKDFMSIAQVSISLESIVDSSLTAAASEFFDTPWRTATASSATIRQRSQPAATTKYIIESSPTRSNKHVPGSPSPRSQGRHLQDRCPSVQPRGVPGDAAGLERRLG